VNDSHLAISPGWPTRWPKDSFTGFWTWFIAAFIALLFVAAFIGGVKTTRIPSVTPLEFDLLIALQFALEGILVAIVLLVLPALSKLSLAELGFRMPGRRELGTALVGAVAMALVANGGATLIDYLAHSQHQQDIVEIFKTLHDSSTVAIFAVFAIVFAPFAEETLFRVLFFNLGLRYWGFWGGAVLSGVLFGMAHGDLYALIPLTLGGMVLCGVYYRTRNAWAPMVSHALFNALSIAALLFGPKVG
jgi:membrane protease YdiL (CAAX protease family)